jgi:hypothetical protein
MRYTLIRAIAVYLDAAKRCRENGRHEEEAQHLDMLRRLSDALPSGAGIDSGTSIDHVDSKTDRICLVTSFHHMNANGFYDGWTNHTITVRPSFLFGVDLKISGRNRNDVKEYLAELFDQALQADAPEWCQPIGARRRTFRPIKLTTKRPTRDEEV